MKPLALAAALVLLAAASAPAQKEDEFPIRIAGPRSKEKLDVTVEQSTDTTITVFVKDENKVHKEKSSYFFQYTDEIIDADVAARLPTKLRRSYDKTTKDEGSGSQGHSLQKQTILIEKRGGSFVYTPADKRPLDKEAKATLDLEFNTLNNKDFRDVMFPESLLVKNGGTWDIKGVKSITSSMYQDVFKFDDAKVKGTGKVENAKPEPKKDKKPQTAKVTVTIEAPILQFALEKGMVKAKDGSKLDITVEGNGHIDGFSPDGTVTLTVKFKVAGTTAEGLDVEIDTKSTEKRTVKKLDK